MAWHSPLPLTIYSTLAREEVTFLPKYGSIVYIIHRKDTFKASKIMQQRALPILRFKFYGTRWSWGHIGTKTLIIGSWGLKVKNVLSGEVSNLRVSELYFVIGHEPATKFLDG